MHSLKKENPDREICFSTFALLCLKWCIPAGATGTHKNLEKFEKLTKHHYVAKKQAEFFKKIKENL